MFQKSEMSSPMGNSSTWMSKATGSNWIQSRESLLSHLRVLSIYTGCTSHHPWLLTSFCWLSFAEEEVGAAAVASRSELSASNPQIYFHRDKAIVFSVCLCRLQPASLSNGLDRPADGLRTVCTVCMETASVFGWSYVCRQRLLPPR